MSSTALRPAADKIGDLQVLRGVAVVLVIGQHIILTPALLRWFPHQVIVPCWLAVDLFFVISGYVIVSSLFRDRFEPFSFCVKRVFRLTPGVLILIAMAYAFNAYFTSQNLSESAYNTFVTPWTDLRRMTRSILGGYFSIQPLRNSFFYGIMWSLSVEDLFYAALALFCLSAAVVFRRHAPRVMPYVVVAAAGGLYSYVLYLRLSMLGGGQAMVRASWTWNYFVFNRFDMLALGVLTAFVDRRFRDRIGAFFVDRGPFLAPFLLMCPFVLAALCGHEHGSFPHPRLVGFAFPISGWCFAVLVLAAAHGQATPPRRGAAYRAWTYLGDRSYSIYLYHTPALGLAWILTHQFLPRFEQGANVRAGIVQLAVMIPLTWLMVEVVYRGVERPLTAVGRRLAARVRIIPADPVVSVEPVERLKIHRAA